MRRGLRYRSWSKQRRGIILVTLVLMIGLLVGIIIGGDEIASRVAMVFAAPEEVGVSELPPSLKGEESAAPEDAPSLGRHTQEMMHSAIVITRRAIERQNNRATPGAP